MSKSRNKKRIVIHPVNYRNWYNFLRPDRLAALTTAYDALDYQVDYPDLNYDAEAVRLDSSASVEGSEFLLHPIWHAWVAYALGAKLNNPGRTVVRARRHPMWSRGFWVHTDRDLAHPKAAAALFYMNEEWNARDGGLLQVWDEYAFLGDGSTPILWEDYIGRRLDFLEKPSDIYIQAATIDGFAMIHARLIDNVLPHNNRLVLLNFQSSPAYHSISPTCERIRKGIVQWIY